MQILQFLLETSDTDCMGCRIYDPRPPIECADGFTMSVQAGQFCDCEPRGDHDTYKTVEVRDVSFATPELAPYASAEGVYSFVPVEVVETVIQTHGGMK